MADELLARARARLVYPLDVESLEAAREAIARVSGEVGVLKVGLELFTEAGPAAVALVHETGHACFLDLKLHDIPETMARAVGAAVRLGVKYLTVHAAAGPNALAKARETAARGHLQLLAVTMLTSLDENAAEAIGFHGSVAENAERLARLAHGAGIDGFVCSPHEASALRAVAGPNATIVTPGVRPAGAASGDQRRVATPSAAIAAGATLLVVGRPIRDAADPKAAARLVVEEIARALPRNAHEPSA